MKSFTNFFKGYEVEKRQTYRQAQSPKAIDAPPLHQRYQHQDQNQQQLSPCPPEEAYTASPRRWNETAALSPPRQPAHQAPSVDHAYAMVQDTNRGTTAEGTSPVVSPVRGLAPLTGNTDHLSHPQQGMHPITLSMSSQTPSATSPPAPKGNLPALTRAPAGAQSVLPSVPSTSKPAAGAAKKPQPAPIPLPPVNYQVHSGKRAPAETSEEARLTPGYAPLVPPSSAETQGPIAGLARVGAYDTTDRYAPLQTANTQRWSAAREHMRDESLSNISPADTTPTQPDLLVDSQHSLSSSPFNPALTTYKSRQGSALNSLVEPSLQASTTRPSRGSGVGQSEVGEAVTSTGAAHRSDASPKWFQQPQQPQSSGKTAAATGEVPPPPAAAGDHAGTESRDAYGYNLYHKSFVSDGGVGQRKEQPSAPTSAETSHSLLGDGTTHNKEWMYQLDHLAAKYGRV